MGRKSGGLKSNFRVFNTGAVSMEYRLHKLNQYIRGWRLKPSGYPISLSFVLLKEMAVDLEVFLGAKPQGRLLEHLDELVSVDQLDWGGSVANSFAFGVSCEGSCC